MIHRKIERMPNLVRPFSKPLQDIVPKWYADLVQGMSLNMLKDLSCAAQFMELEQLDSLACSATATKLGCLATE